MSVRHFVAETGHRFLLDEFPTDAHAAFSLRQLITGFTGTAIRIRRESDQAVINYEFDKYGELPVADIQAFVGASSGQVALVANQLPGGGFSGFNLAQTNIAERPYLIIAGVLQTFPNGRPKLTFPDGRHFNLGAPTLPVGTTARSHFAAFDPQNTGVSAGFGIPVGVGGGTKWSLGISQTEIRLRLAGDNVGRSGMVNTDDIYSAHWDGVTDSNGIFIYKGTTQIGDNLGFAPVPVNTTDGTGEFPTEGSTTNVSDFSEMIFYDGQKTGQERIGITNNMKDYWIN